MLTTWNDPAARWIVQLALPNARAINRTTSTGTTALVRDPLTGATAWVYPDHVTETGSYPVWQRAEDALTDWHAAGSPPPHEFHVQITGATQTISHPAMSTTFTLPAAQDQHSSRA
jgi:hypothetical protein